MTIPPQDLLKKLKPTASFAVDRESIVELARLAISVGEEGFADAWVSASQPVRKPVAPRKAKPVDPRIAAAEDNLSSFAKSRNLRSAECAIAFIRYVQGASAGLPEPTKTASSSIASAVKWVAAKVRTDGVDLMASAFVEKFSRETDYTYR